MFRIALISLLVVIPYLGFAQSYLSPQQKAVMDFYYAQAETNSIDGSWIIDGTITTNKLSTNIQDILSYSVTNVTWGESSSNNATLVDGTLDITFNTNDYEFLSWLETNSYIRADGSVPFTADQSLGTNALKDVSYLTLVNAGIAPSAHEIGRAYYDRAALTWAIQTGVSNVTLQVGQEFHKVIYNGSGNTITNGFLVYEAGETNLSFGPISATIPYVDLASSEDIEKIYPVGFATHDISADSFGLVTSKGTVRDLDTTNRASSVLAHVFLNDNGDWSDTPGTFSVKVGHVEHLDLTEGYVYADIGQWMGDALTERVADALSVQRQTLYITNVAGSVYAEIDAQGGGDITYRFNGADYILDCTTGSGTGGRARNGALTTGTDAVPVKNYIYVVPEAWPVCTLTNSTIHPNGDTFAWVGVVTLQSEATTALDGPFALQRYTDTFSHNGRGRLSYMGERVRVQGAVWESGTEATVTDDLAGNLTVATSSGTVYQMHRQTFSARADGTHMHIANDFTTPYTIITNLNQITEDGNGDSLVQKDYFAIRLIGFAASGDSGVDQLLIQLSDDIYRVEDRAIVDADGFDNNTIDPELRGGAFNIARIVFYVEPGTGNYTLIEVQDKRGELLNASGTGGGSSTAQSFPDSSFRIYDNADASKEIAFEASGISASTTRTYTAPDKDGTLALLSDTSQTPWTNNVNGGGYSLTNVSDGVFTNTLTVRGIDLTRYSATTIGFNTNMTSQEMQDAIDGAPKRGAPQATISFIFTNGTYTLTNALTIDAFDWDYVRVEGEDGLDTLHSNQGVFLDASSLDEHAVVIKNLAKTSQVDIRDLKIQSDSVNNNRALTLQYIFGVADIRGCNLLGNGTGNGDCIFFNTCVQGFLRNNYVSNAQAGITCYQGKTISRDNDDLPSATICAYGLQVEQGGTLAKYDTDQPTGSTANERVLTGGEIR